MKILDLLMLPPFSILFGILIGVVGSEGIWAIVWLVRDVIINRKAKRIQQKGREEYGVMIEDVIRQGGEAVFRTKDRTVVIKSGKDDRPDKVEHTSPHRTSHEQTDKPKENNRDGVQDNVSNMLRQ